MRSRRRDSAPPHTPPPVCRDLRAWCADTPDATYDVLFAAHRARRRPPRTIEASVHDVFVDYYDVAIPEQALVGVDGATIATNGVIVLPDGQLAGETVTANAALLPALLADEPAYATAPAAPRHHPGPCYPLVIGNFANYWHWLHDVLARLPHVLPLLPPETSFAVPAGLRAFHFETLEALGVDITRLFTHPHVGGVRCDRLFFASPYLKPQIFSAGPLRSFADRVRHAFGAPDGPPSERIFISRRNEQHWRTTNEDDVVSLLRKDYGFVDHDLAALTFAEQVRLFSRAELVVGQGAGLANVLFAPAGATVVHVQDPARAHGGHQFTTCDAIGLDYWYFFAEHVANPQSAIGVGDLRVPLDKLEATLQAVLA